MTQEGEKTHVQFQGPIPEMYLVLVKLCTRDVSKAMDQMENANNSKINSTVPISI